VLLTNTDTAGDRPAIPPRAPHIVPDVSPVPRTWTLDWATGSIALSVVGAAISLLVPSLFLVGVLVFTLGFITGVVALRKGVRRNLAIVGIVLNLANLAFDAALVFFAGSR
jgi:hypothetical protein